MQALRPGAVCPGELGAFFDEISRRRRALVPDLLTGFCEQNVDNN